MINKALSSVQRCPTCRISILQRVGLEYYCGNCQDGQVVFEEEIRMVPSKYQSNSKSRKEQEHEKRLNDLIQEFTIKYRDIPVSELNLFRQRLQKVKGETPRKKGSREAAAVVVFVGLAEEIKLTIREFCQQNNLSVRLFNQKYKVYQKLFKSPKCCLVEDDSQDLKTEEKLEESSPTEKSEALSTAFPVIEGARHAISLIFDDVFSKFIFRSKRNAITESLIKRLQCIDGPMLERIKYGENSPLKLYYLIFAVLKALGHKINYLQFSEIIEKRTGYLMKRKAACEVRKHYDAFLKQQNVKEENEEQGQADGEEEQEEDVQLQ